MRLCLLFILLFTWSGCSTYSTDYPNPIQNDWENDEEKFSKFLAYMHGNKINLDDETEHVIDKKEIIAYEFADSSLQVNQGPWSQDVSFVLKVKERSFAVDCQVKYRRIDGVVAFYEYKIETVVEQ